MAARKCTTIPRAFSWVIPAQSIVTGVAIYSTVFVFKVGSKPFIFAVVAAGLQFLLGLYCCFTANKPGIHHAIAIPILLAGIAGVWCAPVYYFSNMVSVYIKITQGLPSGAETPPAATWSYVGLAMTCLDVIIPLTLLATFLIEGLRTPRPPPAHHVPGGYIPAPVYGQPGGHPQYQQQQQPYQYQQQHTQPIQPILSTPSPYTDTKYTPTTTTSPISPPTSPSPNQPNRIDAIRRLCALQYPDGHWQPSPELADLARQWGGRSWFAGSGHTQVTQVAHATLSDLCRYIWNAQWEHAENERLSPGEMASFQMVNWDLGFAKTAMERGSNYMSGGFG